MHSALPIDSSVSSVIYMFLKLLISAILGGLVGYEREVHERPAGLRTHILVCTGATLVMIISLSFGTVSGEPGRIAAQIVSGIGFLGAGTIMKQGNIIHGLTTAASLWMVSAIGMAVGIGGVFFLVAAFTTLLVFLTLSGMRRFEPVLGKKIMLKVKIHCPADQADLLSHVLKDLVELGVSVEEIDSSKGTEEERIYRLLLALPSRVTAEAVMHVLSEVPGLDQFQLS